MLSELVIAAVNEEFELLQQKKQRLWKDYPVV
ncbi:MAG: hypothetical protein ACLRRA_03155 [Acutalibacteraceae bacterium]